MSAHHEIDTDRKLITTTWNGEAVDSALIVSLSKYEDEIRSLPQYAPYDEILDFSHATSFKLTTEGIRRLAEIAVKTDVPGVKTYLAIIVISPVAYGLARMYQTYRSLVSSSSKEVRIFKNYNDALTWIKNQRAEGP